MSEKGDTKDIEEALARPFPADDIEWRVQSSGMKGDKPYARVLAYVTARAIQERLDEVCGLFGWKNIYDKGPDGGVICGISLVDSEGNWITKWDGAENTNIEAVKGGISGAFKRAGSVWGIGRYLYNLDGGFAVFTDKGAHNSKIGEKGKEKWFKWNPPALPAWALPKGEAPKAEEKTVKDVAYWKALADKNTAHVINLKNWYKKHEAEIKSKPLTVTQQNEVILHVKALGEKLDKELADKKAAEQASDKQPDPDPKGSEADAIAQDAQRGAGEQPPDEHSDIEPF